MDKLIIKDDDEKQITYELNRYEIKRLEEELLLTFYTETEIITYCIQSDDRETDILKIESFLKEQLTAAVSNQSPFIVTEYLERMYIFVGDDETLREFSATKIG